MLRKNKKGYTAYQVKKSSWKTFGFVLLHKQAFYHVTLSPTSVNCNKEILEILCVLYFG